MHFDLAFQMNCKYFMFIIYPNDIFYCLNILCVDDKKNNQLPIRKPTLVTCLTDNERYREPNIPDCKREADIACIRPLH